jgi:hypothetical protein
MQVPTTAENKAKILSTMDAAWRYELSRYQLARTPAYDFSRHASDWLDSQLLYYLADPTIHLVTYDTKRLRHGTRGSTQSSRILHFDDLLAMARKVSGTP